MVFCCSSLFLIQCQRKSSRTHHIDENCRNFNLSTPQKACSTLTIYSVSRRLSGIFYEQLYSCTIILYFGMQFVYVIGHCKQQDFRGNFFVSPQQKLPKSIVLLDDTKGPLRLDRTIHPELPACPPDAPDWPSCFSLHDFLFVGPRFRYPFFSPKRRRLNLGSRYQVR